MSELAQEKTVRLGLITDPLTKQLAGMASESDLRDFEVVRLAIGRLQGLGYIPNAVAEKARKKLADRITDSVQAHNLKQKVEANLGDIGAGQ